MPWKGSPMTTNESKQSQTNGSEGLESTKRKSAKQSPAVVASVPRTLRLRSLVKDGGEHPGSGLALPVGGEIFEADGARGMDLVACGLAELAPEGAKGE